MYMSDVLYSFVLFGIKLWKCFTWLVIQLMSSTIKIKFIKAMKKFGVEVNGKSPHDIQVLDERMYNKVCQDGSLGFGQAYMEGWWTCERLDLLCHKLVVGNANAFQRMMRPWDRLVHWLTFELFNLQTSKKSLEVIKKHYDIGNEFFESFLDPSMNYSCGYWAGLVEICSSNLNQAQQNKMKLIGRKLKLQAGMRVLDIGCGYGSLAKYLAENYKVNVVGINISEEGVKVAKERCRGFPVEIRLQDYRTLNEKFDRIVSVGMYEHVGSKNYEMFFNVVYRCLKDGGIFLLHTIGLADDSLPRTEGFSHTYIFPNGSLPRSTDIMKWTNMKFIIEDWHNFGNDYNKTLRAWHSNFMKNWPNVKHLFKENEEKTYRMWTIYFLFSAGLFSSRKFALWQIILTKNGLIGGYESVR